MIYFEDSAKSCSTSFEYMLERFFPYAPVDPAFKRLSSTNYKEAAENEHLYENLTFSKKKIFPEQQDLNGVYSDSLSCASDCSFDGQDKAAEKNSTVEEIGGMKSLLISIKTMPRELW